MAIGPIRLLALPSYRSLTNQILIFAILDLNFSLNLDSMQATSSPSLLYYYVCALYCQQPQLALKCRWINAGATKFALYFAMV